MNKNTYNVTNFDLDPSGTERKKHLGLLSVRFSTGEAYVVLEDTNGDRVEKLLQGEAYRRFLDFLSKNKVLDKIPTDINDLTNMSHMYLDASVVIPDNMETVSVTDVLVEREYTNLEEGEGLATLIKATPKKLSKRTLARDVEVHDMRINKGTDKEMGLITAEDLINAIIHAPLDLDPAFSASSNLRLMTDKDDKATGFIRLELNTMDDPVSETDPLNFENKLLTAKGAKAILTKMNEDITKLRAFSKLTVSSTNAQGVTTVSELDSDNNADTLSLRASELTKLVIGVDENNKIFIKHAKINDASVSIAYEPGKIIGIASIVTDGFGHITEITTKDYFPEMNDLYYSKDEIDANYISKGSTGTEVMNGSLDIQQKLIVRGKAQILGDLITSGESSKEEVKQMLIKDVLMDIGTGNDSTNRHVGFRLVKGNPLTGGKASKDAFLVFDKVDGVFKFIHARISTTDQNVLYDIELADVEAGNIKGTANTAAKLSKALRLLFTGDATGSGEFFGDEGVKEIELTVNKATSFSFGTVKLLDYLPTLPPTDPAVVFSGAYLHELLQNFKTFDTYNGHDSQSTTLVATANAVNGVYSELVAFRNKYDAQTAAQEEEARNARTTISEMNGAYIGSVSIDTSANVTVSGLGLDARKFDKNIPIATQYPEAWNAKYKLKVEPLANRVLFTVVSKLSGIESISMPKIDKETMPGFSFGSTFGFKLTEHNAQTDTDGTVLVNGTTAYNMSNEYREITFSDAAADSTIYTNKFRNRMSMLEMSAYKGTNVDAVRDNTIGNTIGIFPNKANLNVLTSGSFNSITDDVGPFSGATEPILNINGMNYSNMEGINVKLNTSLATEAGDSIYSNTELSVDVTDIDMTKPLMVAFYFKITNKYGTVSPSRQGRINAKLESMMFNGASYNKDTKQLIPWTEASLPKTDALALNKWYLAVSFLADGGGIFTDSNSIRGVYDCDTKAKVMSFNHGIQFTDTVNTVVSSKFKLAFQGMDVKVASAIFAEYDSNLMTMESLLSGSKTSAFKKAINTTGWNREYNMLPVSPDKYYTLTCETYVNGFAPTIHPFSDNTTFDSDSSDLKTLLTENAAEVGFDYTTDIGKDYQVKLRLTQTGEVLDPNVIPDSWLPSVQDYQNIFKKYLDPKQDDVITVSHDLNYGGVATLYKWDGTKWVFLRVHADLVELRAISTEAELTKYYSVPSNGSYMRIVNDANNGGVPTIYYRRDGAWEFLIKASNLNRRGTVVNFEDIMTVYTTPANYDMVDVTSTGLMYIYITDKWVPYGEFQGWTLLGLENNLDDFNSKYKIPVENDWVKVGLNWYLHNGSNWVNQGLYVDYNYTDVIITEILNESEPTQISNRLKNRYTVPKDNDLVRVLTNQPSTSEYYRYHAGTRSWNYIGLYSNYDEVYQNKILNGTIVVGESSISHNIKFKYKYVRANL